jgi:hypothetical protein
VQLAPDLEEHLDPNLCQVLNVLPASGDSVDVFCISLAVAWLQLLTEELRKRLCFSRWGVMMRKKEQVKNTDFISCSCHDFSSTCMPFSYEFFLLQLWQEKRKLLPWEIFTSYHSSDWIPVVLFVINFQPSPALPELTLLGKASVICLPTFPCG